MSLCVLGLGFAGFWVYVGNTGRVGLMASFCSRFQHLSVQISKIIRNANDEAKLNDTLIFDYFIHINFILEYLFFYYIIIK